MMTRDGGLEGRRRLTAAAHVGWDRRKSGRIRGRDDLRRWARCLARVDLSRTCRLRSPDYVYEGGLEPDSGRFLIASRADHFDHASCKASSSSLVKREVMFTRATTTPGISPSSTSWSMRANVS